METLFYGTGFWWGRVVKSNNSTNKQKLEFKRLDDLNIVSNPHFIKIDAEGYEHEIIKGMLNIIKNGSYNYNIIDFNIRKL